MATEKLYKRFIAGLEKLGYTIEDLKHFKYAGGDKGANASYFATCGLLDEKPSHKSKCICEHDIVENCYIVDRDGNVLILGNCCIKKFVPEENQGRRCNKCNQKHRNHKDNYCSTCRPLCKTAGCENQKKGYNDHCETCINKKAAADSWARYVEMNKDKIRQCIDCGKNCKLYKRCWDCNQKFKGIN